MTTIEQVPKLEDGGTLGVFLGTQALRKGLNVRIYSHNLQVFDPSWFYLEQAQIADKLEAQAKIQKDPKNAAASMAYRDFILKGGSILWQPLTPEFLYDCLNKSGPIIIGLSATYLYWSKREFGPNCEYDDIKGLPQGHFIVLSGIDLDPGKASVSDPHRNNPLAQSSSYEVDISQLINATLVGAITYDANLIHIHRAST